MSDHFGTLCIKSLNKLNGCTLFLAQTKILDKIFGTSCIFQPSQLLNLSIPFYKVEFSNGKIKFGCLGKYFETECFSERNVALELRLTGLNQRNVSL